MTEVIEPYTDDEDLENLLEQVADANPDASEVREFVYHGQSMEMIEIHGVSTDEVQVPESDKFELTATEPVHPEDEETRQQLVEEYEDLEKEDFEPPFEPAWISFSKIGDEGGN